MPSSAVFVFECLLEVNTYTLPPFPFPNTKDDKSYPTHVKGLIFWIHSIPGAVALQKCNSPTPELLTPKMATDIFFIYAEYLEVLPNC